jgi:hypothetical protein
MQRVQPTGGVTTKRGGRTGPAIGRALLAAPAALLDGEAPTASRGSPRRSPPLRRATSGETVGGMDSPPTRILVVANRNAATPRLLDEVRRRALAGPCEFALLIPAGARQGDWTFVSALPLMRRAAGGRVGSVASGPDPFASVQNALRHGHYDEIIVSTEPAWSQRWLRRDLVHRIQRLHLPVTVVAPHGMTNKKAARMMVDVGA